MKDRIITFRVNGEEVHFDLAFASKHVNDNAVCYSMDVIETCVDEYACEFLSSNDAKKLELILKHVCENESYLENFSENGVMKKDSYFQTVLKMCMHMICFKWKEKMLFMRS